MDRSLRCPWCLRANKEVHLMRSRKDSLYRCPDCCFMGAQEEVSEAYELLSMHSKKELFGSDGEAFKP